MGRNIDDIAGFPPFGPGGDLDDLMDILKNLNTALDGWNNSNNFGGMSDIINKIFGPGNHGDIKVEGYVRDSSGNTKVFGPNDLFSGIFKKGENKQPIVSANHEKNILIITKILELCKEKNIMKVFNSGEWNSLKNRELMEKNGFIDDNIEKVVEAYNVDLTKIKNVNKFLHCLKYAIQKKELIL